MNSQSIYAYYGSLRRGMSNHEVFKKGLQFLFQEAIGGYQLYAMPQYPYAIHTGNPDHFITVEVFCIKDRTVEEAIHELEMSVGYYYDEVMIRGQNAGIYLFKKCGTETLVNGGDWVQFFRS